MAEKRLGSYTTLRKKGSLTIPAAVRKAARLAEGDPVYVTMTEEGILLKPQKLVDATQAWFWEASWQTREREADEDLTAGRTIRHGSNEEFLQALDQRMKPVDADA
jgi:AbrB family looped-hinge helix DNA binding protein